MRITFAKDLNEDDNATFRSSLAYKEALCRHSYSPLAVQYYSRYFSQHNRDYSMIVWINDRPVLWIPVYSDGVSFSYFNMPIRVFEDMKEPPLITKAYKYFIKWLRDFFKKENFHSFNFVENPFLLYDFFSETSSSNEEIIGVLDLRADLDVIKSNFRKSFKSLINWGEKNLDVSIINAGNYSPAHIKQFQDFHLRISGKKTRGNATWETQGEMVSQGQAFVIFGYFKSALVSAGLFTLGLKETYYAVGVYDRELMKRNLPLAHYSLFRAIQESKRLNIEVFNIGEIGLEGKDEKQRQLAQFKRGLVSQCSVEKSYTVDICQ